MRATSFYRYFAFGYNYGLIKRAGLQGYKSVNAADQLKTFLDNLVSLDLPVTQKIATQLATIQVRLKGAGDELVSNETAASITAEVDKIDPALDAELQLRIAFVLTKKRYDIKSLLEEPVSLLGRGVDASLTESSKKDFALACRQIALNQSTGAAFHLMRTLEEQVRILYFAFKKTKRMKNPMWGPIIGELRKKNAPKPSEKLLNHLDGMRIHFRNPTQHPDAFYTIDEAQDLLSQTIAAVNMIHAELP